MTKSAISCVLQWNKFIKWSKIYLLSRRVTFNTYFQSCQYIILNIKLCLNKKLYTFKLIDNPICSFCKTGNENVLRVFHPCTLTRRLWSQLQLFQQNCQNFVLFNHLLLLFKLNVYYFRNDTVLCRNKFLQDITKGKKIEKREEYYSQIKITQYKKKWRINDQ